MVPRAEELPQKYSEGVVSGQRNYPRTNEVNFPSWWRKIQKHSLFFQVGRDNSYQLFRYIMRGIRADMA